MPSFATLTLQYSLYSNAEGARKGRMSVESILIIGIILLACGCAGLLLVRFDNPRLLGLGWLGAALGTGGAGALLLLAGSRQSPLLSIVVADLLVLGSMVLLHFAVLEVVQLRGFPYVALLLLILQAAADVFKIYSHAPPSFRIAVIGLLVGTQAINTVSVLLRHASRAIRNPARFISLVLAAFITWNYLRSFAVVTGLLSNKVMNGLPVAYRVQALTDVLYLAVALGLAFGFFWMTTAGLTAKLEDLASTDSLTGVLNRRAFVRSFHDEFDRSARLSGSFALLMLDLDHFKQVNDRYGHVAGDEVLCAATENIRDATRGIDIVGRWGGEEFAILLPQADAAAAHIVAQRILANIPRAAPLCDKAKHIPVTASIGVAVRSVEDSVDAILLRADAALYRAKAAGRNCVIGEGSAGILPPAVRMLTMPAKPRALRF